MSDEVVYHNAPKFEEPCETATKVKAETVEKSDRGLFDFVGNKDEQNKCEETAVTSEFEEKVHVSEPESKSQEKKGSLLDKLHRSGSSSSSSSDEECDDEEKKKSLKEKMNDCKDKKEEEKIEKHGDDTCVSVEKYEVAVPPPSYEAVHTTCTPAPEEKKGFMEKIKEKLPGNHNKADVGAHGEGGEHKEKKGIFEKIKEKISGSHSKTEEEKEKEKEKEKECD